MQIPVETNTPFAESLYAKAGRYFSEQESGRYANAIYYAKGLALVVLYVAAYLYFIFFSGNFTEMLFACLLLGICHVFIPVNLAHDAIHGSVSPRNWVNSLFLYGFEITGTNSYMYRTKHLEAHFNKENGSKKLAIESQGLLLQTQNEADVKNLPVVFYLFYSQYLVFVRDFVLFFKSSDIHAVREFVKLFFFKCLYCVAFIVIPILYIRAPWWQIVIALLFMYVIVTVVAVIILLMPTEKMESARMHGGLTDNDRWLVEILEHNVDFSPQSTFLNLIAGGANLNAVHYIFPSVNHVHYNALAALVEETAREYGVTYRKQVVKDVFGIHLNYLKNIQNEKF